MRRAVFPILFMVFLLIWLYTILFFRIDDLRLDDNFSLLSRLTDYFVLCLFALAFLSLLTFYLKKATWSIAFAALFALYFSITPWFLEPLRVIDTFFHFSRVSVVMTTGRVPDTNQFYFDYPGSTIFGTIFLSVTQIPSLIFLKYLFPLLSTIVFSLGFVCIVTRMFKSWIPVGPSLLLATLFGYGGYHFSPFGFAWMIIPVLLFSMLSLERGTRYSLCFVLLSIVLAVSHPTTSAFLIVALPAWILILTVGKHMSRRSMELATACALTFIVTVLAWSSLVSQTLLNQSVSFLRSLFTTLFFHPSEAPADVWQPVYPLVGVAWLRRAFIVLSGVLATVILFISLRSVLRKIRSPVPRKDWLSLSAAFASCGLLLFVLSLLSIPTWGPYYSLVFGLFGSAISFGILRTKSRKSQCLLLLVVLSIILPAFVFKYPVEQWDIMRDPIMYGMQFSGRKLNKTSTILSPFAAQLRAFMDLEAWSNINDMLFKEDLLPKILTSDYVIFRIDGLYYWSLQIEQKPAPQTQYFHYSVTLTNDTSFDMVYSSNGYEVFARRH